MSRHTELTRFNALAGRIWSNFDLLDDRERQRRIADLVGIAYVAPLALFALLLLARATDPLVLERSWLPLLALLGLLLVVGRRPFFWVNERGPGRFERFEVSLAPMVAYATLLLFGPSGLWIGVAASLILLVLTLPRTRSRTNQMRAVRHRLNDIALLLAMLAGAMVYRACGGVYPLAQLFWPMIWPALLALVAIAALEALIDAGRLMLVNWMHIVTFDELDVRHLVGQFVLVLASAVFGILMAAIYRQLGMGGLLFFGAAAVLASVAANQLSYVTQQNIQRTRELEQLEQLGRALITAPLDGSTLPALLAAFVPYMFQYDQIDIVQFPDRTLLHTALRPSPVDPALWRWLAANADARAIYPNDLLPWNSQLAAQGMIIAPITVPDQVDAIGGIVLVVARSISNSKREIDALLPAVQTLAAEVGSAIQGVAVYHRTRALDRLNQELDVAAEIQASFLPERLPELPGWQFAAQLRPARQTSGDFYDLFPLPDGRFGLIVADVADKGAGSALYMALCRTLIRTYAFENPTHPDVVIWAANQRLLADTSAPLFVTVFFATLDPITGALLYVNAGHNAPLLFHSGETKLLRNTGIPLGIEENAYWRAETTLLQEGDWLVMYTDGVNEAQNVAGEFFDNERLVAAVSTPGMSAGDRLTHLIEALDTFEGSAPQSDDQTILIVQRRESPAG